MSDTFSVYDAKARFSEVIRRVRSGRRVFVTYRGERVAEIRPVEHEDEGLELRLKRLEAEGQLGAPAKPRGEMKLVAKRPGALARFLEERD